MPCNFSTHCNQCDLRSSVARYMRNHMEETKGQKGSLTNCLEVKPAEVLLCTLPFCTRVVWSGQESRLGEMDIAIQLQYKALQCDGALVEECIPPPPLSCWNNAISKQWNDLQCSGCQIVCIDDRWWYIALHCIALHTMQCNAMHFREMLFRAMQCLSDSGGMMISGSPGLVMADVWDSSRFRQSTRPTQTQTELQRRYKVKVKAYKVQQSVQKPNSKNIVR